MTLKRQLLHQVQRGLYLSGAAYLYRRLTQPQGAMILMYHSVTDQQIAPFIEPEYAISSVDFALQMRFLKQHCQVISMSDLLRKLENQERIAPNTAVITFDDGYLNNLQIAAPILQKYQLPATLFLCTGYVARAQAQWIDELYCLLRYRSCDQLVYAGHVYNLCNPKAYQTCHANISRQLLSACVAQRKQIFDNIREQLKPQTSPPKLTLNWDDVRYLKTHYPLFELGLHSHDHRDLTALDASQLQQELSLCMQTFEQQMGCQPQFFSYPYGRHNKEMAAVLKDMGIKAAVITAPARSVTAGTQRFMLPRYEVSHSLLDLKLWMSGALPMLAKKMFGRVYE